METTTTLTTNQAAAAGATIGMIAAFAIVLYVLTVIATWKIFKKAGEPGWKCLIPIYNVYIMYKIVGMAGWFWGILLVGILGYIVMALDGTSYLLIETQSSSINFDASAHIPTVIALLVMLVVDIWGSLLYAWRTSKAFGHGFGYFLGLLFFQPIFWLILGFDKSKYHKKAIKN